MKKIILLLVLVLSCHFLGAAELTTARTDSAETAISPLLALSIILIFDVADLEDLTRDYITLGPTGILSTEKYYEKNGVEIRLLGMAHVAEKGFYQNVKNSLHGKPALMLMEGITDDAKLLKTPPDLGAFAEKLGVDSQRDKFSPREMPDNVEIIRADLDSSDFSAGTVEVLNSLGKIYSEKHFNASSLLMMYLKLSDLEVSQTFMKDLLTKRNECLINHLQENLARHNLILVPWGAMHLPEIEKWVANNGFTLKDQKSRTILRFPSYFKYFMSKKAPKDHSLNSGKSLYEVLGI
ncbi:MAG: hypothetical protein KKB51_03695 [Candidatus Riflebacteria bacterium]|nr:hypothetical protein [Candidatus Riflebacteria bacterium]